MSQYAVATLSLDALNDNINQVKRLAPHSKIIAMVKANAYGHGLMAIAKRLAPQVDALGVARISEALQLRAMGIQTPIILMEGAMQPAELPLLSQHQLGIVIHSAYQLTQIEQAKTCQIPSVWIKINTGMNRLGFPCEQASYVYKKLLSLANVQNIIGIMTHFAAADERDNPFTSQQMYLFHQTTQHLTVAKSLANSAGLIAWPASQADWVRPGLMLYGVSPFLDKTGADLGLKPVMQLDASLIAINYCKKGDSIGYNGTYQCPEDMPIGVVSIGYGDGYPRYIREAMPILVNHQLTQVIGLVSMDMLTVDLRPINHANIGSQVTLWGDKLPIEHVAKAAHTSVYELLAGLTARVHI